MSFAPTHDRLFDRTWRSSCPIRPRYSTLRRWTGIALLALLASLIVGYAFITDSDRVRMQAAGYLERLVGGPVEVDSATLSLFEGLRLEGVTIHTPPGEDVRRTDLAEGDPGDDVIFSARSVKIDYDPLNLLVGKLTATRVIAVDPRVRVVEDLVDGSWNFQDLRRRVRGPGRFSPPDELPEILLRNAQVDYLRRFGNTILPRGSIGVEAQLTPAEDLPGDAKEKAYRFAVQTRGLSADEAETGPRASGVVNLDQGTLEANLADVQFSALLDILPRAAGEWWRRHGVAGRLDVPQIRLNWERQVMIETPDGPEAVPEFRVEVSLDGATIQGLPEEWLTPEEVMVRQTAIHWLRRLQENNADERMARYTGPLIDKLLLRPVRLEDVDGSFIFTDRGIRIMGLNGELEGNRLRVDGIVGGYSPDAALSVVVQNADDRLTLPADMPFITSLPRQVREIYDRFSPEGEARLRLELHRPRAGSRQTSRPIVTGSVEVLDGTFVLDRFPYPVHNARGRLLLRYDSETRQDKLIIENLRGTGTPGGPNADAQLLVNGLISPLNSVAGFDIHVSGRNIQSEAELIASLPPPAREAIAQFDPSHHGRGTGQDGGIPPELHFEGDFQAQVSRPAGVDQRWDFQIDLDLQNMSGAFAAFPYPLENATAGISIFPDHVLVTRSNLNPQIPMEATAQALAEAEPSTLEVTGRVDWGHRVTDMLVGRPPLRLDLDVTGQNLPTGPALAGALPDEVADQMRSLGLGGVADVAAQVTTDEDDELAYDVTLDLSQGRFWPDVGTLSLTDVTGKVRVLPDRVILDGVRGRRGDGRVGLSGSIGLGTDAVSDLRIDASDLPLDAAIYELLPPAAQGGWDWLRPAGTADVTGAFTGPTAVLAGNAETADEVDFDLTVRPGKLSVLPQGFPYAMENLGGAIRLRPGRVELIDVTALHPVDSPATPEGPTPPQRPPAKLAVTGTGTLGAEAGDVWTLAPSFENVPMDEALLAALPAGVSEVLQSVAAEGVVSGRFDAFDLLLKPGDSPPDLAFGMEVNVAEGVFDIGMPLAEVVGRVKLAGDYVDGALHQLSGDFLAERLKVSGRPASGLSGTFSLPEGSNVFSVSEIAAQVANGRLGGNVELTLAPADTDEPTHYQVQLAVREADVRNIIGEENRNADDFGGKMTARIDLEGRVGQPASRRGRGEVLVQGEKLYDLPLVLGVLQVTNLALPIAEPFREATTTFAIDGQRIVFDRIELRASDMRMTGEGSLNFETSKVNLTFTTSNHGWAKIPLLGDIVGLARNELLRINVRGTLQKPEVSGSAFPTITSTIDEVFRSK